MTRGILDLYGVKDIRLLPEAMMSAIMNEDEAERHATLLAFLELHRGNDGRIDLSRDIMASMYESELAQRRENKQDFTPPMVSLLASRLTMANGTMGSVHEPTAGNGGMLIAYWRSIKASIIEHYPECQYPDMSAEALMGVCLCRTSRALYGLSNKQNEEIRALMIIPQEAEKLLLQFCAPYAIADDHIKRVTDTFLLRLKEQRQETILLTN